MIAQEFGEGTPLILIHGFGVDHRILLPLERAFENASGLGTGTATDTQNWKRVYLDLPWAQGAEDNGARSPRELADLVLEQVRDIVGDAEFAILGNSFGGMVARHVAFSLREQCVGLATLVGAFQMDKGLRALPPKEVVVFDQSVLESATVRSEDFEFMAVIHTPEALQGFNDFVAPGLEGANQRVLARLDAAYTEAYFPESQGTPPFQAPALHLFAKQDHVVGFEDGLATSPYYPRGQFVVIDGAGHHLQLEKPEEVNLEIRKWLGSVKEQLRIS